MDEYENKRFGKYQLFEKLGEGAFARVYRAKDTLTGEEVAVKIFKQGNQDELRREAEIAKGLQHRHIVRVYAFGVENNVPYLVMEYLPSSWYQAHPKGTPLLLAEVVRYATQLGEALEYAHAKTVVHRDLKPGNLLLNAKGELVLTDFGVARTLGPTGVSDTMHPAGTLQYMAPEAFDGNIVRASDQYSLGIILYEWLVGAPPFTGPAGAYIYFWTQHRSEPPRSLRAQVSSIPEDVEKAVLKALHKKPAERHKSIQAFIRELEQGAIPRPAVPPAPPAQGAAAKQGAPRTAPAPPSPAPAGQAAAPVVQVQPTPTPPPIQMPPPASAAGLAPAAPVQMPSPAGAGPIPAPAAPTPPSPASPPSSGAGTPAPAGSPAANQPGAVPPSIHITPAAPTPGPAPAPRPSAGQASPVQPAAPPPAASPGQARPPQPGQAAPHLPPGLKISPPSPAPGAPFGKQAPANLPGGGAGQPAAGTGGRPTFGSLPTVAGQLPSGAALPFPGGAGSNIPNVSTGRSQQWQGRTAPPPQPQERIVPGTTLCTYRAHTGGVRDIYWFQPYSFQILSLDEQMAHSWEAEFGAQVALPYAVPANSIWSPDRAYFVYPASDGVHVFDALGSSPTELLVYKGHVGEPTTVAWLFKGGFLASGGTDQEIHVWEATTGQLVRDPYGGSWQGRYGVHVSTITRLVVSPGGDVVASADESGKVLVWDPRSGHGRSQYDQYRGRMQGMFWSRDEQALALHCGAEIRIWELQRRSTISHEVLPIDPLVAWSPNGGYIACKSRHGNSIVDIWDPWTGKTRFLCDCQSPVSALAWSRSGNILAVASGRSVQLWDARSGKSVLSYHSHQAPVRSVAWSPDGRRVASGDMGQPAAPQGGLPINAQVHIWQAGPERSWVRALFDRLFAPLGEVKAKLGNTAWLAAFLVVVDVGILPEGVSAAFPGVVGLGWYLLLGVLGLVIWGLRSKLERRRVIFQSLLVVMTMLWVIAGWELARSFSLPLAAWLAGIVGSAVAGAAAFRLHKLVLLRR